MKGLSAQEMPKEMFEEKTDEELMVLYQLGDELAFAVLFKRHSSRIYGYLKSKIREETFVQDVFQSTFLKLHVTRPKYNSSLPFLPWLFTICKNEMVDAIRRQARKQNQEVLSEALLESAVQEESAPAYEINFNEVPLAQQEVLRMRYQDELSFAEIASKLDTTSTNARQLVSRAIRSARKLYGQK